MKSVTFIFLFQIICLLSIAQELKLQGKTTSEHNPLVDSIINVYDIYKIDLSNTEFQKEFDLNLVLGDKFEFKLHLISNELRSKSYKSNLISSNGIFDNKSSHAKLYKGYLDNNPKNRIRLTFYNNVINGFIIKDEKTYRILPMDKWTKGNNVDNIIIFCEEKYLPEEMHMGDDAIPGKMKPALKGLETIDYNNPVYNLTFYAEADYEWYQLYQGNSESTILSIINAADGLFEEECNIKFSVENIDIYTTSSDPFTEDFSNGTALLNELSSHWNSAHTGEYANVVCLFSDKSCPSCGYRGWGRTPGNYCAIRDGSYNYKVLAHEVGHNLGATHNDAYYGSPSSIMDSSLMLSQDNFWLTSANKSNVNNEINNRLIVYSYFENEVLCGNKSFSVSNIPSGFTVTWPKSRSLAFEGNSTGSPVTIKPYSTSTSDNGWVEPTLTKGSQVIKFPKDKFWVGTEKATTFSPFDLNQQVYTWYPLCVGTPYEFRASLQNPSENPSDYFWTVWDEEEELMYMCPSGTGGYFVASHSGFYTVNLIYNNGCGWGSERSVRFEIEECGGLFLLISPNPTTGETTLTIESGTETEALNSASIGEDTFDDNAEWDMEIYSPMQVLKTKKTKLKGKSTTIQTSGWTEGVYTVRVKYKDEILTGKLVVKR